MKIKKCLSSLLRALPSIGLLASLVAVWLWTDSWPLGVTQDMTDEQGWGTHVISASQSGRPSSRPTSLQPPALFQRIFRPAQGEAGGFSPDQVQADLSSNPCSAP